MHPRPARMSEHHVLLRIDTDLSIRYLRHDAAIPALGGGQIRRARALATDAPITETPLRLHKAIPG